MSQQTTLSTSDSINASGTGAGLIACHGCGQVQQWHHSDENRQEPHCCRCGQTLHRRKPNSLSRTWALLLTATMLYIPANTLPIMHTKSLVGSESNTIFSGVVHLWHVGSYDLAIIVFVASVLVPLGKIASLAFLAWHSRPAKVASLNNLVARTRLYRMLEVVGPWSMLDIFVVALLAAVIQFRSLASISPGAGAIAFGAVVVVTMLASMSFDPRIAWDNARQRAAQPSNKTADQNGETDDLPQTKEPSRDRQMEHGA